MVARKSSTSQYQGKSFVDSVLTGRLTTDLRNRGGIYVTDRPRFEDFRRLEKARARAIIKAIIFTDDLSPTDHETLLIADTFIPVVYGVGEDILSYVGSDVTLYSHDRKGEVYVGHRDIDVPSRKASQKFFALTSTKSGMDYHRDTYHARVVATRGEFILMPVLTSHPLDMLGTEEGRARIRKRIKEVVGYGADNFQKVVYRFTDFSDYDLSHLKRKEDREEIPRRKRKKRVEQNPASGSRGAYKLLHDNRELFYLELETMGELYKSHNNISLLVPFVRHAKTEGLGLLRDIKKAVGSREVGCMIEVPQLLLYFLVGEYEKDYAMPPDIERFAESYDFFVIGTKDLEHFITGGDRSDFRFDHYRDPELLSRLLEPFVLRVGGEKVVLISDKGVYRRLAKRLPDSYREAVHCLFD